MPLGKRNALAQGGGSRPEPRARWFSRLGIPAGTGFSHLPQKSGWEVPGREGCAAQAQSSAGVGTASGALSLSGERAEAQPVCCCCRTVWYELQAREWPFKNQPAEALIWQIGSGEGVKQVLATVSLGKEVNVSTQLQESFCRAIY